MKTSLTMSRNMAMIASLILGAMQAAAQTTIYSDNFVGSSSTSLNGAAVQNSPLGPENWTLNNTTAYSAWNADGSVVNGGSATASQNESSILLPFTPVAGNVYTLKGTVNVTSSSTWMGLGFSTALSNASGAEGDFAFGSAQRE